MLNIDSQETVNFKYCTISHFANHICYWGNCGYNSAQGLMKGDRHTVAPLIKTSIIQKPALSETANIESFLKI